ncbi:flagellin N-terminal helical domain-containing protein [Paracraurococcus lichenis]|uniref:Flagellin n=1 Tax=Paracraurococcus lichenis TaxID=3064888 RepID=A0ABT9EB24_9PROT|nr:flagellin [Paracraurococcus sp. LOR1-02]MDO9713407.1 flagellin [Paracraurococcus sp. LOR1-02]
MTDRIAPAGVALGRQASLQSLQARLAQATAELSSGRKSDPTGGLGLGASLLYKLHDQIAQGDALDQSVTLSGRRMEAMQTALSAVSDTVQTLSTNVLKIDTLKGTGYNVLAAQARDSMASMADRLNVQFDGQHLFAGTDSTNAPLTAPDAAGGALATVQAMLTNAVNRAGGPLDAAGANALVARITDLYTGGVNWAYSPPASTGQLAVNDAVTFSFTLNGTPTPATFTNNTGAPLNMSTPADVTIFMAGMKAAINAAAGPGNVIASLDSAGRLIVDTTNATDHISFGGGSALQPVGGAAAHVTLGAAVNQVPVYTSKSRTGDGKPNQVAIGAGETVTYDVRADNPAIRDSMMGGSLLSLLDAASTQLGDDAKSALLDQAGALLRGAHAGLTTVAGVLGAKQERLQAVSDIQSKATSAAAAQINTLEATDYAATADQINQLQLQLQATYSITAKLSELSFVNYLK